MIGRYDRPLVFVIRTEGERRERERDVQVMKLALSRSGIYISGK